MRATVVLLRNQSPMPVLTENRIVLTIVELIDLGLVASFDRSTFINDAEFPFLSGPRCCKQRLSRCDNQLTVLQRIKKAHRPMPTRIDTSLGLASRHSHS